MTDKLDIVGIGNAMVDAIIPSNKGEVEKNNLNRDSMNLIDEDLKNKFMIIGSAHNNSEIKIKELQKVEQIFLSSLFKENNSDNANAPVAGGTSSRGYEKNGRHLALHGQFAVQV